MRLSFNFGNKYFGYFIKIFIFIFKTDNSNMIYASLLLVLPFALGGDTGPNLHSQDADYNHCHVLEVVNNNTDCFREFFSLKNNSLIIYCLLCCVVYTVLIITHLFYLILYCCTVLIITHIFDVSINR